MEFYGILAGVAVRPAAADSYALINGPTLVVLERSHYQLSIGSLGQGCISRRKNLFRNGDASVAGHSDDANSADLTACGNGGNDIRHDVTSNPSSGNKRDPLRWK